MARLDHLYSDGTTFMSWAEIYHWYKVKRLSKAPWRDIHARWLDLLQEQGSKNVGEPQTLNVTDGVLFFLPGYGGPLKDRAA